MGTPPSEKQEMPGRASVTASALPPCSGARRGWIVLLCAVFILLQCGTIVVTNSGQYFRWNSAIHSQNLAMNWGETNTSVAREEEEDDGVVALTLSSGDQRHDSRATASFLADGNAGSSAAEVSATTKTITRDRGSRNVDLTYLPWELDSIMSLNLSSVDASAGPKDKDIVGGRCVPPTLSQYSDDSHSKMCCLGSSTAGGQSTFRRQVECAVGREAYEHVRLAALDELNSAGSLQLISSDVTSLKNPDMVSNKTLSPMSTCDICRIVELSNRNNWTIGFTGDSVQRQVWDGFLCELKRHGYHYITISAVVPPQGENARWRFGLKMIHTVSIHVGGTAIGPTSSITARFYAQYRPLEDMSQIASLASETDVLIFNFGVHWLPPETADYEETMNGVLSSFQNVSGGFALLAMRETGAQHFANPGGEYTAEADASGLGCVAMEDGDEVLGWRERIVDRVADRLGYLVLRSDAETLQSRLGILVGGKERTNGDVAPDGLAPLFDERGEDASASYVNKTSRDMVRRHIRRLQPQGGQRGNTRTSHATAEELPHGNQKGHDELLILPFLNFTRHLVDLHKIGVRGDCTHFCSSPFLGTPLWRSLRLGMEYRLQWRLQHG